MMINPYVVISNIKSVLENSPEVSSGNCVVFGYNTKRLPNPLRKIYTVIKPLSLVAAPDQNGDAAVFTVGINIHKAERYDPTDLLSRFSFIVGVLEGNSNFNVVESGFKEMKRNEDTNSIVLPCYIKLRIAY